MGPGWRAGELKGALGAGRLAGLLPLGDGLLGDVEAASELLLGEGERVA
jgi:hypothetical protein